MNTNNVSYLVRENYGSLIYESPGINQVVIYENDPTKSVEFAHFFDLSSYYNFGISFEELDELIEMLKEVQGKIKELSK